MTGAAVGAMDPWSMQPSSTDAYFLCIFGHPLQSCFSHSPPPRMQSVSHETLRAAVSFGSTWASFTICRVGSPWAQARRLLFLSPGELAVLGLGPGTALGGLGGRDATPLRFLLAAKDGEQLGVVWCPQASFPPARYWVAGPWPAFP